MQDREGPGKSRELVTLLMRSLKPLEGAERDVIEGLVVDIGGCVDVLYQLVMDSMAL